MTAFLCRSCGENNKKNFYKTAKYQCKTCWNTRTANAGKEKVLQLKTEAGAKCLVCGYNKCIDALEFHHLDPSVKEFHLGEGRSYSIDKIREELKKCILVCRNCHTEIHYKMKQK